MNGTRRAGFHAENARYLGLNLADGRHIRGVDPPDGPGWRLALEHAHAAGQFDPALGLVDGTEQTGSSRRAGVG